MSNGHGRTDARTHGLPHRLGRGARAFAGALALCCGPAARLSAQVGYDPAHSPFADVNTKQTLTPFVSRFLGNTGHAGVGAQSALGIGGRFATRLTGSLEFWVTAAYIRSQRSIVDPSQPAATRVTGPVDFPLVSADLSLALNVTGPKTWHGLAPYVGLGLGLVAPTASAIDPGGFKAESHLSFVPTIGTRMRIGRSTSLTLEARDNLIRYSWPLQYFFPTDAAGNPLTPPVLDPATEKSTQVTHNFTLTAGLSYHFNF